MSDYLNFHDLSHKQWQKQTVDKIMQETETLLYAYYTAVNKPAVVRGYRKKIRRILNRGCDE